MTCRPRVEPAIDRRAGDADSLLDIFYPQDSEGWIRQCQSSYGNRIDVAADIRSVLSRRDEAIRHESLCDGERPITLRDFELRCREKATSRTRMGVFVAAIDADDVEPATAAQVPAHCEHTGPRLQQLEAPQRMTVPVRDRALGLRDRRPDHRRALRRPVAWRRRATRAPTRPAPRRRPRLPTPAA